MPEREQHHASVTPVRRRRGRRAAVLVVFVLVALAAVQWRYDVAGGLWPVDPDTDPGAVAAPEGIEIPPQPVANRVARALRGGELDAAAVRRALAPQVSARAVRPHLDVVVAELSGEVVYRHGRGAVIPASTTKLLTSLAALDSLGQMTRFTTAVRRVPGTHRIVLVGGGDPFLASTAKAAGDRYPARASTAELAARAATELRAAGVTRVRLGYDATLFSGPAVNPAWPDHYLPDDVVPPISALWVDEARGADGRYVDDPAREAARTFARQLEARGVQVRGDPVPTAAAGDAVEVAAVESAPLGQIVERLLAVSDNNAAEVVLRHVGLAESNDGSFRGGTTAVRRVLDRLGVSLAGLRIFDGSGLSRRNRLRPGTLVDVLGVAAGSRRPDLRAVVTGLPVAGFSGSLATRYQQVPEVALGRVRAKTGTLTGVSGLAGIAVGLDGTPMIVIALADHVAVPQTMAARVALDRITAAAAACRCGETP